MKAEQNPRYDNNEGFAYGKQGHKQWDRPQNQPGKAGKGVHGQSHGQTPIQRQQSTNGPAQHVLSKTTGMAPVSATARASGYQTASKAVVTKTEPAAPEASTQNDDDYVYVRVPREKMAPIDNGLTDTVQHQVSQSVGYRMQHQFFTPFRCSRRKPRLSSGVEIPAPVIPRVSRSCSLADVVARSWIRQRTIRICRA